MDISKIPTLVDLSSDLQTSLLLEDGTHVGEVTIDLKSDRVLLSLRNLVSGVILQYREPGSSSYRVSRQEQIKADLHVEMGSSMWISYVTSSIPVPVVLSHELDIRLMGVRRVKLLDSSLDDVGLLNIDNNGSSYKCYIQSFQNHAFSVDFVQKECRGFIDTIWNCSSTPRVKWVVPSEKKQKMSLSSINVDKKVILEYNQSVMRQMTPNLVFACLDGEFKTSTLFWNGRFDTLLNFEQPTKCEFKMETMRKLQQVQTGCFSGECITEEVIEAADYYQVELGEVFWALFEQEAVKRTPESYINSKIERVRHAAWKFQKGTRWYKDVHPDYKGELLDQLAGVT